jgi:hypothetical protein
MKVLEETLSIEIGINLWFAPQISEHCPYTTPGRSIINLSWLRRPGTASTLIPNEGMVHEWRTSMAVISIRTCIFIGIITRLSVSISRNISEVISLDGII